MRLQKSRYTSCKNACVHREWTSTNGIGKGDNVIFQQYPLSSVSSYNDSSLKSVLENIEKEIQIQLIQEYSGSWIHFSFLNRILRDLAIAKKKIETEMKCPTFEKSLNC